jgi:aspartyl aminopeptidase
VFKTTDNFRLKPMVSFFYTANINKNIHSQHTIGSSELQKGLVIKTNANQRYATTAMTAAMLKRFAAMAESPVQEFVVRQDMGCGSTIGPIVSTAAGLPTVDVGAPQFAMHSIREMAGCDDVIHKTRIMRSAYSNYTAVDQTFCHTCSM